MSFIWTPRKILPDIDLIYTLIQSIKQARGLFIWYGDRKANMT